MIVYTDKSSALAAMACARVRWENVGKNLKQDLDVVLAFLKHSMHEFPLLPQKLRANKQVALRAAAYADNFRFCSKELRDDNEVFLKAMRGSIKNFSFASKRIKANKELALVGVKVSGFNYLSVAKELREDDEIIKSALRESGSIYEHLSEEKRDNPEYLRLALATYPKAYSHASESLRQVPEFIELAIADPLNFASMPQHIRFDLQYYLKSIRLGECHVSNYIQARDTSQSIKANKDAMVESFKQSGVRVLEFVDKSLLEDKEFLITCLEFDLFLGELNSFFSHATGAGEQEVMLQVIKRLLAMGYTNDEIKEGVEEFLPASWTIAFDYHDPVQYIEASLLKVALSSNLTQPVDIEQKKFKI